MNTYLGLSEAALRLSVFGGVFLIMGLAEALLPRRDLIQSKPQRWLANLGLAVIASLVVRFTFPMVAIGAAALAETNAWGLLALIALPSWLATLIAVIILDLAIYVQHIVTHKVPVLWRLHQVHHADRDIDVTTGIRFHPIEIALSMAYKIAIVIALGAPPIAVLIFEVILNAMAMFSHANLDFGSRVDRWARLVLVTPDMHRVHHSVIRSETDSNYGFNISLWDRVFGTYQAQPRLGQINMTIGLEPYQSDKPSNLVWALLLPFRKLRRKLTDAN